VGYRGGDGGGGGGGGGVDHPMGVGSKGSTNSNSRSRLWDLLGVFVTREHVRHNKSGIAHRGRTGINH
jgi:hypothetical protein